MTKTANRITPGAGVTQRIVSHWCTLMALRPCPLAHTGEPLEHCCMERFVAFLRPRPPPPLVQPPNSSAYKSNFAGDNIFSAIFGTQFLGSQAPPFPAAPIPPFKHSPPLGAQHHRRQCQAVACGACVKVWVG